jgi:translation elongation factor EF-Ts
MIEKIKLLKEKTGMSLTLCKRAILYTKNHKGCTALGYLKAHSIAIATPNMTFEEKVRKFSHLDKDIL